MSGVQTLDTVRHVIGPAARPAYRSNGKIFPTKVCAGFHFIYDSDVADDSLPFSWEEEAWNSSRTREMHSLLSLRFAMMIDFWRALGRVGIIMAGEEQLDQSLLPRPRLTRGDVLLLTFSLIRRTQGGSDKEIVGTVGYN